MRILKLSKGISFLTLSAASIFLNNTSENYAQVHRGILSQNLNLRIESNSSSNIITRLKKGYLVDILEFSESWCKIKYKNYIGYVSSQYIEKEPSIKYDDKTVLMEASIDCLKIFDSPSQNSKVVLSLNKGNTVELLYENEFNLGRIKYNNLYGYVDTNFLNPIKVDYSIDGFEQMYCNIPSLNLKNGPSIQNSTIGHIKLNDMVEVIDKSPNNWYRIRFEGNYFFVNSKYLSFNKSSIPLNNSSTKVCVANNLRVRTGPSSKENTIGLLNPGDEIEVIYNLSSGWSRIRYKEGYAYICTKYIK